MAGMYGRILNEVAHRGRELPWLRRDVSFRATDGVRLTGRHFGAWAGLLAAGSAAEEPVAEELLLEVVHRALASGQDASLSGLRSGLVEVAATALVLAERLDSAEEALKARSSRGISHVELFLDALRCGRSSLPLKEVHDEVVFATDGRTFPEALEALLDDCSALDSRSVWPMMVDAGMTAGELLRTPKSSFYCASPGCGHGDNVHGPFCFAKGCDCLEWTWPGHG